jgi:hypothetical protein
VDPVRVARLQRDAAIERVGSMTKAIGTASVAAVIGLGVYFSQAAPGHTSTPAGSTGVAASVGATTAGSGGGSQGGQSSGLTPPANAPVPVQQQAPVVSGSS